MLFIITPVQNNFPALGLLLIGVIVLSLYLSKKKTMSQKKRPVISLKQEEILPSYHDDTAPEYGADPNEVRYNRELNLLKIRDVKSLKLDTKALLIRNDIETIGDLKYSSLDFLLNFSDESPEGYLQAFYECKTFIKMLDYKNGRSILDI